MNSPDYEKQAAELCKLPAKLMANVMVKHTAAVLECVHDEMKAHRAEVDNLKHTVGTLITWLYRELGEAAAKELLARLEVNISEAPK